MGQTNTPAQRKLRQSPTRRKRSQGGEWRTDECRADASTWANMTTHTYRQPLHAHIMAHPHTPAHLHKQTRKQCAQRALIHPSQAEVEPSEKQMRPRRRMTHRQLSCGHECLGQNGYMSMLTTTKCATHDIHTPTHKQTRTQTNAPSGAQARCPRNHAHAQSLCTCACTIAIAIAHAHAQSHKSILGSAWPAHAKNRRFVVSVPTPATIPHLESVM